jgi:glutamate-1-semialdehyde 2,1-aminomutase
VACAVRLARAFRRRDKVLKFEGGFHGMSDYALLSNQWLTESSESTVAVPVSAGIPRAVAEQVLVAPFNDLAATQAVLERHHDHVAAVVMEPLERTFVPDPAFLRGLRELTEQLGILLVFDEVVTGFRLAYGGAQERYGVVPDLCALGKSVSSGFPFSAVCGRADVMALLDPARRASGDYVAYTGTYSGNAVSSAAALAAVRELAKPGTYERLYAVGTRLMKGLAEALGDAGVPAQLVGEPPAFEVWFSSEPVTDFRSSLRADRTLHARFTEELFDRGVVKAHEKFFVSAVLDDDDVELTLAAFRGAADAIAGPAR